MYTVGIFQYKLYVINSRRLFPLVQRLSKTLSFTPFQVFAAKAFSDCSDATIKLYGNDDFMRDLDKATKAALAPGPFLDYQNGRTADALNVAFNKLLSKCSTSEPVRLPFYAWSRDVITAAATHGIYGDSNPFANKEVADKFWYVQLGLAT